MGQGQGWIMAAEDSENDFLIEFLPIKKGVQPRLFVVHGIVWPLRSRVLVPICTRGVGYR
jgi:hypothetical protein